MNALQRWFNLQSAHETCRICHCKHLVGPSCGNKTSTTQGTMCFVPRKQERGRLVWTSWFTRQKRKFRRKDNRAAWMTGEVRNAEQPSALPTKDGDKNKIMEEWDYCFCHSAQILSPRICDSVRGRLISSLQRGHEVKNLCATIMKDDIILSTADMNSVCSVVLIKRSHFSHTSE